MQKENIKEIVVFLILTFLITWSLWLFPVLNSAGLKVPVFLIALSMAANFGPTFSAFILTAKHSGKTGVKNLLKKGVNFRFGKLWFFIILSAPIIGLLSFLIVRQTGYEFQTDFFKNPYSILPFFFMMTITGGPLGEEFGWRGYLLERLQKKFNSLNSSLILGLIHGIWHLPLFFIAGTTQSFIPFWEFMAIITFTAPFYTFIFNNTGKSIAGAILFHSFSNLTAWMFPYWHIDIGRWVFFSFNLILLFIIICKYGYKNLKIKDPF